MKGACGVLGIAEDRCQALNQSELQDNPKEWWNETAIITAVKEYIEKWKIDAVRIPSGKHIQVLTILTSLKIITFDHGGISGHINHRAVSSAVE